MFHSGFAPIIHVAIPLLIAGLIIYGLIMLVLNFFTKKSDSAIQILRERFAKGEIDEEEYKSKITFLKKK